MKTFLSNALFLCAFIILSVTSLSAQCEYRLTANTNLSANCSNAANFVISPNPNDGIGAESYLTWQWNFGDPRSGNNNVVTGSISNLVTLGFNTNHTYSTPGSYNATLTLTLAPQRVGCDFVLNGATLPFAFPNRPTSYNPAVVVIPFTVTVSNNSNTAVNITGRSSICQGATTTLSVPTVAGNTYQWQLLRGGNWVNVGSNSSTYTVPNNLPLGPNIFRVTTTTPYGCISTSALHTIVVQANPIISISGNTKICNGMNTTLTAFINPPSNTCSSAYTYLWNTGATTQSITVTPTANSTYSVTVTCPASGCSGIASIPVYIMPSAVISLVSQSIRCTGATSIVSLDIDVRGGTPPYTYRWNNGVTTQDLLSVSGSTQSYCVAVTDANGCKTVKCFDCLNPCGVNTNFLPPSPQVLQSINNNATQAPIINPFNEIKAFPNPFDKELIVELPNGDDSKSYHTKLIKLYNMLGQLVRG